MRRQAFDVSDKYPLVTIDAGSLALDIIRARRASGTALARKASFTVFDDGTAVLDVSEDVPRAGGI